MYFAFPWKYLPIWMLSTFTIVAIVVLALLWIEKKRKDRLTNFAQFNLLPRLILGPNPILRKISIFLIGLGVLFLMIAIAQPHWGSAWEKKQKLTRDVLLVIDTSESMLADDLPPNRLERVRQKIYQLLDRSPGDRFGIIAFSGEASLVCPLTLDHGYVKTILRALNTDMLSKEGTDLNSALGEAYNVFKEDIEKTGKSDKFARAVIIFSDGEDLSEKSVEKAKRLSDYVVLIVVGMGTPEGAEIKFPEWMRKYVRTSGIKETYISKLDENKLKEIALAGEGLYIRGTIDDKDIDMIIEELEKVQLSYQADELRYQKVNRYRWPLVIALGCFLAENLLWIWLSTKKMNLTNIPSLQGLQND